MKNRRGDTIKEMLEEGETEKHTKGRGAEEETTAAICFDVQNMITLPRANVSNLFYERKLNCCN
jgi:hypothetical protein